jgi:hypothetical protein
MRVFNFRDNIVLLNNIEVTGWDEGDDVITVERAADAASHKIGAGGEMVISLSSDKSGSATFKLLQTSSANKKLLELLHLQEAGSQTFVPVTMLIKDVRRQDSCAGTVGYIVKMPSYKRGAKDNGQEWKLNFERVEFDLGDPMGAGSPSAIAEALG